jgi:hypothetical protein
MSLVFFLLEASTYMEAPWARRAPPPASKVRPDEHATRTPSTPSLAPTHPLALPRPLSSFPGARRNPSMAGAPPCFSWPPRAPPSLHEAPPRLALPPGKRNRPQVPSIATAKLVFRANIRAPPSSILPAPNLLRPRQLHRQTHGSGVDVSNESIVKISNTDGQY